MLSRINSRKIFCFYCFFRRVCISYRKFKSRKNLKELGDCQVKKTMLPLFLVLIFPILMLGSGNCYASNATVPFNYDELTASVYMNSPIENGTYTVSDIDVDVYMHAGSHESEPGIHYIPYQDISCLCSLDGGDWQNMSLSFVKEHEPFTSLVNEHYYHCTVDLNYTATLYNVSDGAHQLRFRVTPLDSTYVSFVHHPASANASERLRDYFEFTVAQNPSVINETIAESSPNAIVGDTSDVTLPTTELFTLLVIASFSGAILILAVVMVKRKHLQKTDFKKDL